MNPDPISTRDALHRWEARFSGDRLERDPHLQSLLRHHERDALLPSLRAFGRACARTVDTWVRENNRDENLPVLTRYDRFGNRTEGIRFHPTYHDIGRAVYGTGLMSLYATPGREVDTLAHLYVFAQSGEAGHACPIACTAGLIKILQQDDADHTPWLERLLDPDYDTHYHGSQFLTEIQGGSDVGQNTLRAIPHDDGTYALHGEKWFCSVIDAHLFLVTARPTDARPGTAGLQAFVVPRTLPDGGVNDFRIRRLKYKLGTRSMASAEVDFEGARATRVGDFRRVLQVVLNTSRLYNAICSCGMMQRAWSEADAYARERVAFGRPILEFPSCARVVARLRAEAYAARGLTFTLAALGDRIATGRAEAHHADAWRMLVNLNKYWTSSAGTLAVRDAIEVLGGNGAIEEFTVLPRLLRDSIVCEAWEGSHNVLCAQTLRDARRHGLHRAMFRILEELGGPNDALTRIRTRWETVLEMPEALASLHVRDVVDELRPVAQAQALRAEAERPDSDPVLETVVEHLLAITTRNLDPLDDPGLAERIRRLVE